MKDKDKRPRFSSLRQFSWSGSKDKGEDERLIESTVLEWYEQKHGKPSPEEAAFVNSIPIRDCPHCRSRLFARHGKGSNGIQRYKCLGCGRRFTPLTGTIFDSRKIPISEWIEFLVHLFEYHSPKTSAKAKGLKDAENPMDPINDVHDKMEKFMSAHPGYARSRLQDWMNLFWFVWCTPGDKMDKVKEFLKLAVSKRIRIKYREVYGKKSDEE